MNMPEKKPKQNIIDDPNREYVVGLIKAIGGVEKTLSNLENSPTVAIMKALQEKLENGNDVASFMWSLLRGPRGEKGDSIKGDPGPQGIPGVKGDPGEPGKSIDEGELLRKLLKSIPDPIPGKKGDPGEKGKDAVVDYAKIIDSVIEKLPKNKDAKKELLKISVKDIADFPEIGELVKKYVYEYSESRAGATIVAPGASNLLTLADVNPKDLAVGYVPTWNGSQFVFQARDSGMAGGSDTQVQFNDGGVANGSSKFVFDKATGALTLNGKLALAGGGGFEFTALPTYGKIQTYSSLPLYLNPEGNNVSVGLVGGTRKLNVMTSFSMFRADTSQEVLYVSVTSNGVNYDVSNSNGRHIWSSGGVEVARIDGSGRLGLQTSVPTHTITLGSTSTGMAMYNTADQTTNYERLRGYWSGNVYTIGTEQGGTGGFRGLTLSSGNGMTQIKLSSNSSPAVDFTRSATNDTTGPQYRLSHSGFTASTGVQTLLSLVPTISQTGTAGWTALLVNPSADGSGSGAKYLADLQVAGVSKFRVLNTGVTHTIMPDTSTAILSTVSNAPGGTTGLEFRYNSVGGGTNIARIMAVVGTGGGGDINFDTASGGGSSYTTKMVLARAGVLTLGGGANANSNLVVGSTAGNVAFLSPSFTAGSQSNLRFGVNTYESSAAWASVDSAISGWVMQFGASSTDSSSYFQLRHRGAGTAGSTSPTSVFSVNSHGGIVVGYGVQQAPTGGAIIQGNIGAGTNSVTAKIHIGAGTATASTAPLKFTAGVVNTTPEAGAVEFVNAEDGLTFVAVATRRKFVFDTATQTLSGKRITNRVQTVASSATVTPSWDNDDVVTITAQAAGLTLANPTGTPTTSQKIVIRIKDNGTARTIAYGAQYRAIGVTLPTTTVISKTLYLGGFWNEADSKFDITSVAQEA